MHIVASIRKTRIRPRMRISIRNVQSNLHPMILRPKMPVLNMLQSRKSRLNLHLKVAAAGAATSKVIKINDRGFNCSTIKTINPSPSFKPSSISKISSARIRTMPNSVFRDKPFMITRRIRRKLFLTRTTRRLHRDSKTIRTVIRNLQIRDHRHTSVKSAPKLRHRLGKQRERSRKQTDSNNDSGRRLEESEDLTAADASFCVRGEKGFGRRKR